MHKNKQVDVIFYVKSLLFSIPKQYSPNTLNFCFINVIMRLQISNKVKAIKLDQDRIRNDILFLILLFIGKYH